MTYIDKTFAALGTTEVLNPTDLDDATPHRIDLGAGRWVDIRPWITRGERTAIKTAASKRKTRQTLDTSTRQGRIESFIEVNDDEFEMGLLEKIIVGWSWPEPISRESINMRPERVTDRVLREFNALNPNEESEEGKASDATSPGTSAPAEDDSPDNWPG